MFSQHNWNVLLTGCNDADDYDGKVTLTLSNAIATFICYKSVCGLECLRRHLVHLTWAKRKIWDTAKLSSDSSYQAARRIVRIAIMSHWHYLKSRLMYSNKWPVFFSFICIKLNWHDQQKYTCLLSNNTASNLFLQFSNFSIATNNSTCLIRNALKEAHFNQTCIEVIVAEAIVRSFASNLGLNSISFKLLTMFSQYLVWPLIIVFVFGIVSTLVETCYCNTSV